jgi:hypothetical protein
MTSMAAAFTASRNFVGAIVCLMSFPSTEVTNLLMIWQVVFLVTDLIAVIWGFELAALDSKVATLLKIASFLIERIDRNHLISSAIKANAFGGSPMPVSCQSVM